MGRRVGRRAGYGALVRRGEPRALDARNRDWRLAIWNRREYPRAPGVGVLLRAGVLLRCRVDTHFCDDARGRHRAGAPVPAATILATPRRIGTIPFCLMMRTRPSGPMTAPRRRS